MARRLVFKGSLNGTSPIYRYFPVNDSQTIYAGDIVILSNGKASIGADAGYDEKFIKVLKSNINKTSKKTETLENIIKQKFRDMEFKELTKDPNFEDADLYRDDIEKFMDKTGLNAEQAYLALFGKSKLLKNKSDIEREAEQRVINNYKKKENIVIDTTDTGKQMTDKVKGKLTNDEIEIAKAAGMTPQEYYALKNSKTIEQINKVLKKKGWILNGEKISI